MIQVFKSHVATKEQNRTEQNEFWTCSELRNRFTSVQSQRCERALMLGTQYPCSRAVNTGVILDTREHRCNKRW